VPETEGAEETAGWATLLGVSRKKEDLKHINQRSSKKKKGGDPNAHPIKAKGRVLSGRSTGGTRSSRKEGGENKGGETSLCLRSEGSRLIEPKVELP